VSALEETPVMGAARDLMHRHGARLGDAHRYVEVLAAAGLLFDPEHAEDIEAAGRDKGRADARVGLEELREQLAAARETVAAQQEELSALRPPHRTPAPAVPGLRRRLTGRQRAVLLGAAWGEVARETAAREGVTPSTAQQHRDAAMSKLKARTTTQAVALAMAHGLITAADVLAGGGRRG